MRKNNFFTPLRMFYFLNLFLNIRNMHYVEIYSEIEDTRKGDVLSRVVNFDNVHLDRLDIFTFYDATDKCMLITKIKCAHLKTLNNTIHDLLKTQNLAEKILEI